MLFRSISVAVLLFLCANWRRLCEPSVSRARQGCLLALLIAANWMHGSAFLWGLPVLAFLCARQWRGAIRLASLTAVGVVVGAALSGHPLQFLWQGAVHAVRAAGGGWPSYLLVGEFQPSSGSLQFLVCVGLIVAAAGRHRDLGAWARNPVAWLAAIGWLLGLSSQRFWFDWGLPGEIGRAHV